jgi:putative acetyltransferase
MSPVRDGGDSVIMATMMIRSETSGDYEAIASLLIDAFADHPHSHQTEHLIVDALRRSNSLTVSLAAEVDGEVAGHVAFSPVKIEGMDVGWFALGPVAVARSHRRRGIGAALIQEGLKILRSRGAKGCVVVGDPAYYSRFGFRHDAGLKMEGVPPEVFMSLPMDDERPQGHVVHDPAFSI